MKKKLLIPILAATVLSACTGALTGAPPEPKITGSYTCECSVKTDITPPGEDEKNKTEFAFGGTLTRLGAGFWEMELSSPETLRGMKISSSDGDVTSCLEDMKLDLKAENIPDNSPVFALFSSLDKISASFERGSVLSPGESGGWCYNEEGVSAVFDSTGCPVSLAAARPAIKVEFTAFELYTQISSPSETSALNETTVVSSEVSQTAAETSAVSETTPAPLQTLETTSVTSASSVTPVTAAETSSVSETSAVPETTSVPSLSHTSE